MGATSILTLKFLTKISQSVNPFNPRESEFFGKRGFKIFKALSRAAIPLKSWYAIGPAERVYGSERVEVKN